MDYRSWKAWFNCHRNTASTYCSHSSTNSTITANYTNNTGFLAMAAVVTAVVAVMTVMTAAAMVTAMMTVVVTVMAVMATMTATFLVGWSCFFGIAAHCISCIFSIFFSVVCFPTGKFFGIFICSFFLSLIEDISTIACIDNIAF